MSILIFFFFFNDTATTEIYTLSLHDALPIYRYRVSRGDLNFANPFRLDPVLNVEATTTIEQHEITLNFNGPASKLTLAYRSEEHTSELQSQSNLVCRLLLEKKKKIKQQRPSSIERSH